MRAMILAAGRGERMRPLTDTCPKPLLPVGGKPLIAWHLERLARAGIREVVVNHAHLGSMIEEALGDGARWGLSVAFSPEREALETAGGIANALPLLGDAPFLVVNGDIWCDFDFARVPAVASRMLAANALAWCLLVDNPPQHPAGDFTIDDGRLGNGALGRLTFSGIGVYAPALFAPVARGSRAPLAPLLRGAADAGRALADRHDGTWIDVGTAERLARLDAQLRRA
jgi:N-acetyl-alpha-D-muramate 1-phosphate uridylyltransferase